MSSLSQSILELLGDADGEVVGMTLRVLTNVLQNKDMLICSSTALQLAEALLALFNNVRLCVLSHGHRLLPRNFVPCGLFGPPLSRTGLVGADVFSVPPGQQPCAGALP